MTDQGNNGDVPPPAPGPAAPPPLADAPPPLDAAPAAPPVPPVPEVPPAPPVQEVPAAPPVQQAPPAPPVQPAPAAPPAQPAYQAAPAPAPAPYYPPPTKSGAGAWPLFAFLAFLVGVGGTVLTLWLTGDLWGSKSSSSSGSSYSSGSSVGSSSGSYGSDANSTMPAYVPSRPPPTTTSGYAPTSSTLVGSWAENCAGSTNDRVSFYGDGSVMMEGEMGTYSVNGNYVTLTSGRGQTMVLYWEMSGSNFARARRSGESQFRSISRC